MADSIHRLHVDHRDTANWILHDHIELAVAVPHALLWHAAEIDRTQHSAVFGVNHRCVLRGVTEDIDSAVERVEVDAVGPCRAHINAFYQGHRSAVEHRH